MKIEDYPNYSPWLAGETWPGSEGQQTYVGDMAPQHAAAALAKLVRWAVNQPQGMVSLLPEVGEREELVRRCPLGRALSARAQNLQPGEDALFHPEYAEPQLVRQTIAAVLVDSMPALEGVGAEAVADAVYRRLTGRWQIVEAA